MRNLTILGSTGSIGVSTLEVVRHLGEQISVKALAAHRNIDLLEKQIAEFQPECVAVYDEKAALDLKSRVKIEVIPGMEGLEAVAVYHDSNLVISAISGAVGLVPTLAAIEAKKDIGLANKEVLVAGGALVMDLVSEHGVNLLPIDSEHSAIFQCLNGENKKRIGRIILTSSGGPFRIFSDEQFAEISVESALEHPTWSMGQKITIDSSTLMNKGLEVIEAYWLFGLPLEQIDVVIHPQSIIHSMVEFVDGSMFAQLSEPSMTLPIQYAITYPDRTPGMMEKFDFLKNSVLEFYKPDLDKFRCLSLACAAVREGGSAPCYLNAANEVLVSRFLNREIHWKEIAEKLENLLAGHQVQVVDSIETILEIDQLARQEAKLA